MQWHSWQLSSLLVATQVYLRERETIRLGVFTHILSLFLIVLPHVLVSAVLTAVIIIPWVNLNPAGVLPITVIVHGLFHFIPMQALPIWETDGAACVFAACKWLALSAIVPAG